MDGLDSLSNFQFFQSTFQAFWGPLQTRQSQMVSPSLSYFIGVLVLWQGLSTRLSFHFFLFFFPQVIPQDAKTYCIPSSLFLLIITRSGLLLYSHDTTIQIYRCREMRNTDDSSLFRYETFINFLTLVFLHKERDTIFTMLTVLSDPTNALRIP